MRALKGTLMKSVLITGVSRGIGFETALVLGRAGYNVFATMRNPSRSPRLAEIAQREGLPITVHAMDVDSDVSVKETIAAIQRKHGPLDVLVNNAGAERRGSVEELPISEVRALMETNFFGPLRCIQAVMPDMRERRSGCIINISSVAGKLSSPPLTAYAASKFALEALSEGLAQEAKTFNIRVAIVQPGIIDTDMARGIAAPPTTNSPYLQAKRMAEMFSKSLQQEPVQPEVVARKVQEIIESDSWTLRYPTGPHAAEILQMRASMTDEEWVSRGAE
jgi:NAD(P)-dependent dehydrogenase (short-subunit alcohol dehydrogenase family)